MIKPAGFLSRGLFTFQGVHRFRPHGEALRSDRLLQIELPLCEIAANSARSVHGKLALPDVEVLLAQADRMFALGNGHRKRRLADVLTIDKNVRADRA